MSIADMVDMESLLNTVVDKFEAEMKELYKESPEIFEGRSTETQWNAQVTNAGLELIDQLAAEVEKIETKLHAGEYFSESVLVPTWSIPCKPAGSEV